VNAVFETTKCAPAAYGIVQVVTDVVILYRATETLHDAVFMNVEFRRQWEVVIGFQDFTGDADSVMLPFTDRPVFKSLFSLKLEAPVHSTSASRGSRVSTGSQK
jgi:hypothetical protein